MAAGGINFATLGLKVERQDVEAATAALDRLTAASARTEAAAGRVGTGFGRTNVVARDVGNTMRDVVAANSLRAESSLLHVEGAASRLGAGARRSVLQMDALVMSFGGLAAGGENAIKSLTGATRALGYLTLSSPALFTLVSTVGLLAAGWEAVTRSTKEAADAENRYKDLNRARLEARLAADNALLRAEQARVVGSDVPRAAGSRIAIAPDLGGPRPAEVTRLMQDITALTTALDALGSAEAHEARMQAKAAAERAAHTAAVEAHTAAMNRLNNVIDAQREASTAWFEAEKRASEGQLATVAAINEEIVATQRAQSQAWARDQEAAQEIGKQTLQRMQHGVARFFDDVFRNGVTSVRSLFDEIRRLWIKLLEDMAAQRLVPQLAGVLGFAPSKAGSGATGLGAGVGIGLAGLGLGYGIGAAGGGAVGGALGGAGAGFLLGGPLGAAIGGLTGLIGGLFGSAHAAEEARKRLEELRRELVAAIAAFGDPLKSSLQVATEAVLRDAETLRTAARAAYPANMFNTNEPAYQAALAQINGTMAIRIVQLQQEAKLAQARLREDLEVRMLRARGRTEEADALALQLQQERELAQARKDGADAATLARLQQVQLAEAQAAAAAKIRQTIEGLAATISNLTAFRDALKLNPQLTPLSPMEQLREARRQYEGVLAAAQGGDQRAAGQLPAAAQAYLAASRAVNASGMAYVADFNRVLAETEAITQMFADQKSLQERQLEALLAIRDNTADQAAFWKEWGKAPETPPKGWPKPPLGKDAASEETVSRAVDELVATVGLLQAGFKLLHADQEEVKGRLDEIATSTRKSALALVQ